MWWVGREAVRENNGKDRIDQRKVPSQWEDIEKTL
jgi:hypothetical protein